MTGRAPPTLFASDRIARNRDRAAAQFDDYGFLKRRESSHLGERLADVSRHFSRALDIGSHSGQAASALITTQQVDEIVSLDPSARFTDRPAQRGEKLLQAPLEPLNFNPAEFDLVTSVLSLHWVNDLPGLLSQIRTVLKPDGLFLGCLFGGGTLTELRSTLLEAEAELVGGASPRLSPLPGLKDMAGLMQRAGFAMPVADLDQVTVRYDNPLKLLADLKGMGETAAFDKRGMEARRPLSRRILSRMAELYHERFSDADGRIRASFEIIWLSGWAPSEDQPKPLRPGSATASLAEAVRLAKDKA